jgi:hypothetical protein
MYSTLEGGHPDPHAVHDSIIYPCDGDVSIAYMQYGVRLRAIADCNGMPASLPSLASEVGCRLLVAGSWFMRRIQRELGSEFRVFRGFRLPSSEAPVGGKIKV